MRNVAGDGRSGAVTGPCPRAAGTTRHGAGGTGPVTTVTRVRVTGLQTITLVRGKARPARTQRFLPGSGQAAARWLREGAARRRGVSARRRAEPQTTLTTQDLVIVAILAALVLAAGLALWNAGREK